MVFTCVKLLMSLKDKGYKLSLIEEELMATVSHSKHINSRARDENQARTDRYSPTEMITLVIGFTMIMIVIAGIFQRDFLGFDLSFMHSFVLAFTGALAIWAGMILARRKLITYRITLGLGIFYLINALAGALLGDAVMQRTGLNDELVSRIAPGFLELNTQDHIMHASFALWFLLDAFILKRRHKIMS